MPSPKPKRTPPKPAKQSPPRKPRATKRKPATKATAAAKATASAPAGSCPSSPPHTPARRHKAPPPPNWHDYYLSELEITGRMTDAAAAALITLAGVRKHRKANTLFAAMEEEALACCRDRAMSELTRRAIDGVEEVTITATGIVNRRRVYSDTLLLRLLEYQETGSFRQKQQVEHSGGIASAPTLADAKRRLAEAKAASAADEAASLGGGAVMGAAYVKAEG